MSPAGDEHSTKARGAKGVIDLFLSLDSKCDTPYTEGLLFEKQRLSFHTQHHRVLSF